MDAEAAWVQKHGVRQAPGPAASKQAAAGNIEILPAPATVNWAASSEPVLWGVGPDAPAVCMCFGVPSCSP
jgi:hypothetical protein